MRKDGVAYICTRAILKQVKPCRHTKYTAAFSRRFFILGKKTGNLLKKGDINAMLCKVFVKFVFPSSFAAYCVAEKIF